MDIIHENVPGLVQEVTFKFNKEDYADKVEAALKKQRRMALIPGFRPGNAPMGIIKRMYAKTLLIQEVNNILQETIDEYFKSDGMKIMFEPLPNIEKTKMDFDNPDLFEFAYQYALAPDFELDYTKMPAITEFKIIPTEKQIEKVIRQPRERYGRYVTPEISSPEDGLSLQYDGEHYGFTYIRDLTEEIRPQLVGKKLKDTVNISLKEAFGSNDKLAHFLRTDEDKLEKDNEYRYDLTIVHISRMEPAELNEEFFQKAFKDGSVKNEEELKQWASKKVLEEWKQDLNQQLLQEISDMMFQNVEIDIPKDFMLRYLIANRKEEKEEDIKRNLENYVKIFKWQLIENRIVEESEISVSEEEIRNYFYNYFQNTYFSQFEEDVVKDNIKKLVDQAIENSNNVKNVYNILLNVKLVDYLRTKLNFKVVEGDVLAFSEYLKTYDKKTQAPEEKTQTATTETTEKETGTPTTEVTTPKKTTTKRKTATTKTTKNTETKDETTKPKASPKTKKNDNPTPNNNITK